MRLSHDFCVTAFMLGIYGNLSGEEYGCRNLCIDLHPGEEEIRRTFLREAAECVDPVRCKKVQRLKSTGAKAASLGAGMLLQKMALDLIDGTENTGILFLEEDELLAVLQERMHRDKGGALSFSY